jgi:hypothetical protein
MSYVMCGVPDGIDLAQGACKPRMNVPAQCCGLDDQGIIHQFQAGETFSLIFKASRQPLRPVQPPIQSMLRVKWLGQEANQLSLSSAI